jgi:hypothetical protein
MQNLTPNFTLEEMIFSDTACLAGINNTPDATVTAELTTTCWMLETIRAALGDVPISVSSGYRCPELNAIIGGVPDSQHQYGQAADICAYDFGSAKEVFDAILLIDPPLSFDQLIMEEDQYGNQWVHISQGPEMRQEAMYIGPDGQATTVST